MSNDNFKTSKESIERKEVLKHTCELKVEITRVRNRRTLNISSLISCGARTLSLRWNIIYLSA